MYIYQICLKNNVQHNFISDDPLPSEEYQEFYEAHEGEVEYLYCDHFLMTMAEWIGDDGLHDDESTVWHVEDNA